MMCIVFSVVGSKVRFFPGKHWVVYLENSPTQLEHPNIVCLHLHPRGPGKQMQLQFIH